MDRIAKLSIVFILMFAWPLIATAQALTPLQLARVEKYKAMLVYWASQPIVINATKEANRKPFSMSNSAWDRLDDRDPIVIKLGSTALSKQLAAWEADENIIKLNLRDINGNLVGYSARSGKPLIFNSKNRQPFINGMLGSWAASEIKPDPSTQNNSIQISAPVMAGDKAIGVLHSAVLVK